MTPAVERVVRRIRDAEEDLSREVAEQRKRWRYRTRHGRVWFAREARHAQKRFRRRLVPFIRDAKVPSFLVAPVLYSLIVPLALIDLCVTAYLNGIEKINCTYCSYANGLIAYIREVAARTEQYWCPIKHARTIPAPHSRYHTFFDYGDAEGYRRSVSAHPPAR